MRNSEFILGVKPTLLKEKTKFSLKEESETGIRFLLKNRLEKPAIIT